MLFQQMNSYGAQRLTFHRGNFARKMETRNASKLVESYTYFIGKTIYHRHLNTSFIT